MPIVTSTYWNLLVGSTPELARRDEEGLRTMRNLARNMAWLLRCTINRCKSHFRSVWQTRTDGLDETLSIPFTPAESEVMKAVGDLPMKYRQVIYLHYIQGYTTAEIASLLELNQNTVLSQLARGWAMLKNTLKGEF